MSWKWNKDEWILKALKAKKYIVRKSDGAIFSVRINKGGNPEVKRVTFSTHKPTGRVYFNMTFDGITKSVLVNRVVGLALIPNPSNLAEVNHIDGNKANNRPENLEWASRSEQEKHAFATNLKSSRGSQNSNSKLSSEQVLEIRRISKELNKSASEIAKIYDISSATVYSIVARKIWKHV